MNYNYTGTDELRCAGFAWDRVNSFHSTSVGLDLDLCWKVLTTQGCGFVTAEQWLHREKGFFLTPPHQ